MKATTTTMVTTTTTTAMMVGKGEQGPRYILYQCFFIYSTNFFFTVKSTSTLLDERMAPGRNQGDKIIATSMMTTTAMRVGKGKQQGLEMQMHLEP